MGIELNYEEIVKTNGECLRGKLLTFNEDRDIRFWTEFAKNKMKEGK